jgi:hypothetical protein
MDGWRIIKAAFNFFINAYFVLYYVHVISRFALFIA